ncbi:MAG: glycosyltransferase, partial [Thermoplasmata archaeon]
MSECINSLTRQSFEDLEIICVSTVEELPEEVRKNSEVIVEKRKGVSLAKNVGIMRANHELIALTDDDCVCDPDWMKNLVLEFDDEAVGCVTGGTYPTREGIWYPATNWKPDRRVFAKDQRFVPPWSMGAGNNLCLRKKAIVDVGLFDEELGPGTRYRSAEDIDVFHRMTVSGYCVVYTPKATVRHEPLDTYDQVRKMMSGYRVGIGAFFAKHKSSRSLRSYFFNDFLRAQLRDSRNNFLRGNGRMGHIYFLGFLGALKGYYG